ncbi:MAG: LCP family protein [Defluviitaleaceae bacterium]|nr:LCP family protein [Defluviitaleaceae bacterium]
MVGIFNGETGYVDLISVPRDSVVEVTPQLREEFAAIGRQGWVSGLNSFILAEMTTRARPHGREFIQNHLEAILDIEIDYYVAMDLAAFRYIVDAVGGISMYIPQPGLRYFGNEYGPGGIDIDVPPGYQMLDGRRAEMVVRFRNHPRGDLFRVELQQQFMTNFFAQSLNQESIMNDPMTLVTTFITHVETNLGIISAAQYNAAGMFGMLNADNIAFHMMPGRLDRRYIIDEAAARQLVADIRDGTTRMEEEESFDD